MLKNEKHADQIDHVGWDEVLFSNKRGTWSFDEVH